LQWTTDFAHEVAQKNEASLEQTEHEQIAIRVRLRNFSAELAHPSGYVLRAERNALDRPPIEARVFN
jgi:hypothetical protein